MEFIEEFSELIPRGIPPDGVSERFPSRSLCNLKECLDGIPVVIQRCSSWENLQNINLEEYSNGISGEVSRRNSWRNPQI